MSYVPAMRQCTKVAKALIIAGIAFRALVEFLFPLPAINLPAVDTFLTALLAGNALRCPEERAEALLLLAIGSVLKALFLPTGYLLSVQLFALYFLLLRLPIG